MTWNRLEKMLLFRIKRLLCCRSRPRRWVRPRSWRLRRVCPTPRRRSRWFQTSSERLQRRRKPETLELLKCHINCFHLQMENTKVPCSYQYNTNTLFTWILWFLESATMMFPSSSTVTPLGRVNSPSFVPSQPRNWERDKQLILIQWMK